LASEFIGLPNRRQFPDYYNLIKHPMSLSVMQEKLAKTGRTGGEAIPPASTGGGLKLKLKIGGAGATPGTPIAQQAGSGQSLKLGDDKYEGYRDLDEVKRDFDLIWGNAKRCEWWSSVLLCVRSLAEMNLVTDWKASLDR
jgi:hypothetical protein